MTSNLIDATGSTPAERYEYVLTGLLAYLTKTQSQNLVKKSLAQALPADPSVVALLIDGNAVLGWPNGLLSSSVDPTQPAISEFLGGLTATYTFTAPTSSDIRIASSVALGSTAPSGFTGVTWRGKLLVPTTGAYSFAIQLSGMTGNATLAIGGQPVAFVTPASPVPVTNLTAGQLYDISVVLTGVTGVTTDSEVALQWCLAPASLATLAAVPPLAFMPCDPTGAYPTLALLYRTAVLVNGFSMIAAEIAYFSTNAGDFAGIDPASGISVPFSLASLPAAATADPPALFNQWQRLNAFYGLKTSLPAANTTLIDVFAAAASGATLNGVPGVVATIAAATGWDPTNLQVLAGSFVAGNTQQSNLLQYTAPQFRNEIPLVRIAACLAICSTVGLSAQQLFKWANPAAPLPGASPYLAIALDVQNTVKAKYDDATWLQVGKPLNDAVRESSKEALIAYILYLIPNPAYPTVDYLYGFFLIDVEMCTCMETSRLVQATAAVQLFVQRCLLNLESPAVEPSAFGSPDSSTGGVPSAVMEWNRWRKNYRVWQAAVQVFLYPENWNSPELRLNETPFFADFETALLKSAVTEDNVEAAFLDYLESLQQVARLEIMGLYVDDDLEVQTRITHVIGRTFGKPYVYFYRTLDNIAYTWSPWEQINADISGDSPIPVIWNRRLFLFWSIYTEVSDPTQNSPTANISTGTSTSPTSVTPPQPALKTLQIQLACSEYKNGNWTPKQVTSDFLTPTVYRAYPWTLDPTSFLYGANIIQNNGIEIVIYSRLSALLLTLPSLLDSANAALSSFNIVGTIDNGPVPPGNLLPNAI